MTYPIIVLSVMVVIFLALLIFIVPVFQKLFASLHAKLPLPTQVVIGISKIVLSVWSVLIVAMLVGGIVWLRRWIKTEHGRLKWDAFKLKPPIFGQLVHKVSLARLSHTLGSLIQAGVPILESLDIVSETAGNQVVGNALARRQSRGARRTGTWRTHLRDHEEVIPRPGHPDGRGG